jgi:hypothetical protein
MEAEVWNIAEVLYRVRVNKNKAARLKVYIHARRAR